VPNTSRLLNALNPEQRAAVLQTEGPVLILAGAGSGKTRVITTRIAYLIAENLAEPSEILAMTFTNKAAAEMRDRVAKVVGKRAAAGIVISTFHSFCVRVLRAEIEHVGYRRNFTISTESDARTLVRRSLKELEGVQESFDPDRFIEHIGTLKSSGLDVNGKTSPKKEKAVHEDDKSETDKKYEKWLPEVYERYQSALRAANTVDFDDLLLLTLRLWREHPRVLARYQKRFRYVMVDEYQDTNRVQYGLLGALAGKHRNLCVVGDDDQSIYGWRGADIANILNFEKEYPEAKVVKLEQNYRSTETILAAANSVIANNTTRRAKKLWSKLGKGRPIDRFITGDEEAEAKEAAAWLKHIQEKTGAKFKDFAVLYRSNLQSRPYEIAFRQAEIPYTVVGGQEFFERAEIKDIVAYLKVIANPRDEASLLRIVNVPKRRIGDATLHLAHDICRTQKLSLGKGLAQVLKTSDLAANTKAGIQQFLSILSHFGREFRDCDGCLCEVTTALLDHIDYRGELFRTCKSAAQFEARWANVEALLSALADYETRTEKATLSGFLDVSALAKDQDRQTKEERRQTGVTLMTIHSAKGLEFPFVFLAGLEEGLMPHVKSISDEAIEEERRLFYVALTRGKRHVTLFESLSRDRYGKKAMSETSRFLEEVPAALVNTRVRAAKDMVEAAVATPTPAPKPKKRRSPRRKL
jgi:superfamily I DNA/RNA helicase